MTVYVTGISYNGLLNKNRMPLITDQLIIEDSTMSQIEFGTRLNNEQACTDYLANING